jgi:hypothetical protein
MYLGANDINYIEQERKTFSRLDYADRELAAQLVDGFLNKTIIRLSSVIGYEAGDVLVQDQLLTVYDYNMLLKKLDLDPGAHSYNYYSTLQAVNGCNLKAKLIALAVKLNADSLQFNNYNTLIGAGTSFTDLRNYFNLIITQLNSDSVLAFSNYSYIQDGIIDPSKPEQHTIYEAIITNVNGITKELTLNLELPYVVGQLLIYKSIASELTYSPCTMGDPLGYKHLRESTLIFENKAFTSGTVSFSTDLLPMFVDVNFNLGGNGIFGASDFGDNFFGGNSHSAPFRTYIPRNCQRCTYINVKFKHHVAREKFSLFAITLTGEIGQSSRAYR